MRFPAKITSSCIWVALPTDWVILRWFAWDEDWRSGVRSRDYQIFSDGYITSFSYPWCSTARAARESSAITHGVPQGSILGLYVNDLYQESSGLVKSNLMLTTLRYISRLRQKTLIHVYAKLLRISNMLQSGVAPTTFWLTLIKPGLSYLGWGNLSTSCPVASQYLSLVKI